MTAELWSGFIGALIGGACAIGAQLLASKLQRDGQDELRRAAIARLLQALLDEIETVWQRYEGTAGAHVETLGAGQGLFMIYPVYQDYFPVFHGNTLLISQIEGDELRHRIVRTYMKAKGLVDSLRLNNGLAERFFNARRMAGYSGTQGGFAQAEAESLAAEMQAYGGTLRQSHLELKADVQELIQALRRATKHH